MSQRQASLIQLIIDQHFQAYDELGSARAEGKRQQLFDQVGDVAIGLTPLALALAKPAIEKGLNWVAEKLGMSNSPTPDVSSQESPTQDEHTGQPQSPSNDQPGTNLHPDSSQSKPQDAGQNQAPRMVKKPFVVKVRPKTDK